MTNEDTARAFSGHRFEETFDRIATHASWNLVGEARLDGRDAIIEACQGTQGSWLKRAVEPAFQQDIGGLPIRGSEGSNPPGRIRSAWKWRERLRIARARVIALRAVGCFVIWESRFCVNP